MAADETSSSSPNEHVDATRAELVESSRALREKASALRERAHRVREGLAGQGRTEGVVVTPFESMGVPAAIVPPFGLTITNSAWRTEFAAYPMVFGSFAEWWATTSGDPHVAAAVEQVLEGGAGTDIEIDLDVGSERRHLLVQISPMGTERPRALVMMIDVTAQHQTSQRLYHDATHDALTQLPNRPMLMEQLTSALERNLRYGERLGLIYLDLDGFKQINDDHGHAVGDVILGEVAARWRSIVRHPDLVARVGGDEFVVLVPHVRDTDALSTLATRLASSLDEPFVLGERTIRIGVSAGIVVPSGDLSAEAALALADHAMYEVKRQRLGRDVPDGRNAAS